MVMNLLSIVTAVTARPHTRLHHGGNALSEPIVHTNLTSLDLGHVPLIMTGKKRGKNKKVRNVGRVLKARPRKTKKRHYVPVTRIVQKARKTCPFGLELRDGVCVRPEPVCESYCEEGLYQLGDTCVGWRNQDFEWVCDDNRSVYTQNGFCVYGEKTIPEPICPQGWEMYGNMCRHETMHQCDYECPKGYTFTQGECLKEMVYEREVYCPEGFHFKDNECQMEMKLVPVPKVSCPKTIVQTEGRVLSTEKPSGCPYENAVNVCEHGGEWDESEDACILEESSDSDEVHGMGLRRRQTTSRATKYYDWDTSCGCDDDVEIHIKTCKPQFRCPEGTNDISGRCTVSTRMSSTPTCPAGYELDENDTCVRESIRPSGEKCPSGFVMRSNECQRLIKTVARKQCPYGFELNDRISHPTCVKKVVRELITNCTEPEVTAWEPATCTCDCTDCHVDAEENCVTYH